MNALKDFSPAVAIGLPVFNGGLYLREALESIAKQTYPYWECVIIDNKSTDNSNEIANEFVGKDKRFKLYVNGEFVDQTTNWNIAYRKSNQNAQYFKILCADDWLFPTYLEKMIAVMEVNQNAGFCSSYRLDERMVRCDGLDFYQGNCFEGKSILIDQLKNSIDVTGSASTVLYRKKTIEKLAYYPDLFKDDVYHIDTILAYDVLNISDLGFVFEVLSFTRRHIETYTSSISNQFKTGYYLRERELRRFLKLDGCLKAFHKRVRLEYAYFHLKNKLFFNRECVNWHNKYLENKFSLSEYIRSVISNNIIARQFIKIDLKYRKI